ncbi:MULTISPECIES: ABC transporter ATP-binding protein/permease [Enterococcus]|uniref:Peptide ABC transporter ATPase n=1 Tax=Enterococcus mundtii TaxID=53346 RepID=A0AAI8RAB0_ENTMU|nr:ABC transporter ATP-binding protein/permease [Enterococcus mundtii]GEN17994.1 sulfate ABC transporter ATP-binding protein [Ligilactobacillus acidipiscis]AUB51616.1 sulfate ABC transporter ATP-binding protein [Enterococcus mundtii]MBE9910590.1 ABC transporter ATP-binding protein/permease [Enterococcus mundtii]MCA6775189.1 ABC transporter ATP-binding protein/permease [Enterococcus mundtii]MDB7086758.1 ABC transporter ATP-binding protein/permease [Enterococcus mundtii]
MLQLKEIKKYYKVGETTTKALDGVSVAFRKKEFVAILGPSGSGKTTMLNVIGGLDNYDSGDMVINGKSTKDFKDSDWDAYRNNSIGFVFQSYNLIGHLGIIENVELGMTLSGVSKDEKRKKAEESLRRVGLTDHMHKKPNQLSGGQMQRVAIARALANDPDILLCDEPTGALDTETSVQIMKLIEELSNEKLVIMVTHNPELAHEYADRIIEFSDGKIVSDSNPHIERPKDDQFNLRRTKMSFWTALKLSFNNIRTKKGRTFLTSFASSIGIIGIAIVLALSTGFQKQIDQTQSETMARFPITISKVTTSPPSESDGLSSNTAEYPDTKTVTAKISDEDRAQHTNNIDQEYVDYVTSIDPDLSNNIGFTRTTGINLLRDVDGKVQPVSFSNQNPDTESLSFSSAMSSMTGVGVSSFPTQLDDQKDNFLESNYSLLSGSYPTSANDVVLIVDGNNNTNINALKNLGFDVKDGETLDFDKIVGTTFKLVNNDTYYTKLPTGNFIPNTDYQAMYEDASREVKISGILRVKSSSTMNLLSPGIAYSDQLTTEIVNENKNSEIVQAQKDSDMNVLTTEKVDDSAKQTLISYLGGDSLPSSIMIYPNNFGDKEEILNYLDEFNKGKSDEDKIIYSDLAGTMTELTGGLMDAITYVLIAFAGISLVTSMIMISIITYTSVIERTKEIGVLKALGARKKDITRVFDAETCILGISSGLLGVLIAWLATFPINSLLYNMTDLENVAQLNPVHALILIVVSTILTMLGGHIPARMAAKKDAAIALRAE